MQAQQDRSLESKTNDTTDPNFSIKAGAFLASVAGMSAICGFGGTLAAAKKKDPVYFNHGVLRSKELAESGTSLAVRALGWGTLYAFTGCGILFYTIWKLSNVKNLTEFRMKMGSMLPRIPRNDPPQGRTEFENLTDLLLYVSEEKDTTHPTNN